MSHVMRIVMLVALLGILPSLSPEPARADSDTASRLEYQAQQASNSGRYDEAKQLRAIAQAIRDQDSVVSRQIQAEIGNKNYDKAREILHLR